MAAPPSLLDALLPEVEKAPELDAKALDEVLPLDAVWLECKSELVGSLEEPLNEVCEELPTDTSVGEKVADVEVPFTWRVEVLVKTDTMAEEFEGTMVPLAKMEDSMDDRDCEGDNGPEVDADGAMEALEALDAAERLDGLMEALDATGMEVEPERLDGRDAEVADTILDGVGDVASIVEDCSILEEDVVSPIWMILVVAPIVMATGPIEMTVGTFGTVIAATADVPSWMITSTIVAVATSEASCPFRGSRSICFGWSLSRRRLWYCA